jgi:hypothetical protein
VSLKVDPAVRELMPAFLSNRKRDLEALRAALQAGDLGAVREVGHNIRAFSRVYGIEELTALGEDIRAAADEGSSLRISHLQRKLADCIEQLELG